MAVYFIKAIESNRIKIGFTLGDPQDRLKQLQTSTSDKLEVVATHKHGSRGLEKKLHRQFKHLHIKREWFRDEADLRQEMLRLDDEIQTELFPAMLDYAIKRTVLDHGRNADVRQYAEGYVRELIDEVSRENRTGDYENRTAPYHLEVFLHA